MPFILNPSDDTHEYMMKLKASLRSELQHDPGQGNETALPSHQDQRFGDTTIYTAMDDFWKLFESGLSKTTVTCQACGNESVKVDPFDEILLKFPDKHHTKKKTTRTISLDDLLNAFSGAKSICTIQDRECSTCNMRTAATKREDIISYPRVLIIVLERNIQKGGRITTRVDFPVENHFLPSGAPYHLVGTVHHKATPGSTNRGHYIAVTRSDDADCWHHYNDDRVTSIPYLTSNKTKVHANRQSTAYVLCYQRSSTDHDPSHNLQAQVQDAQVIHASDEVTASLFEEDDNSASLEYNYDNDHNSHQSGSSPSCAEPGNEDNVTAQPSIEKDDGGDIESSIALAGQNDTGRVNAQGNEVELECNSDNESLFPSRSSAHEESNMEENEIREPIRCPPPACSETRQSTVDNGIIVAPQRATPALSKNKKYLMQEEGHECWICQVYYRLRDATLGSFCNPNTRNDDDAICEHVFCYECIRKVRTKPNAMYPECPGCRRPGRIVRHEMVPYSSPHRGNAIRREYSSFDLPLNDENLRGDARLQLYAEQRRCMLTLRFLEQPLRHCTSGHNDDFNSVYFRANCTLRTGEDRLLSDYTTDTDDNDDDDRKQQEDVIANDQEQGQVANTARAQTLDPRLHGEELENEEGRIVWTGPNGRVIRMRRTDFERRSQSSSSSAHDNVLYVDVNDIPSQHICCIVFEPPFEAVYFDVENAGGGLLEHVFERSSLYRHISCHKSEFGVISKEVLHPINRQPVPRGSALALFRPVTAELQNILHRERQALGLPLVDTDPINENDEERYQEMLSDVNDE